MICLSSCLRHSVCLEVEPGLAWGNKDAHMPYGGVHCLKFAFFFAALSVRFSIITIQSTNLVSNPPPLGPRPPNIPRRGANLVPSGRPILVQRCLSRRHPPPPSSEASGGSPPTADAWHGATPAHTAGHNPPLPIHTVTPTVPLHLRCQRPQPTGRSCDRRGTGRRRYNTVPSQPSWNTPSPQKC